jgi:hypothetical protein
VTPPAIGDELLPDAQLTFRRSAVIPATPEEIWPWLVQLGKSRAGWYLPRWVEQFVPARRRALHVIDPRWQSVAVGDRVPDYGPNGYFDVAVFDPPVALVYRSERGTMRFTWALTLHARSASETELSVRFRARTTRTGWRSRALATIGDLFDWATTELMVRGLRERVAASVQA